MTVLSSKKLLVAPGVTSSKKLSNKGIATSSKKSTKRVANDVLCHHVCSFFVHLCGASAHDPRLVPIVAWTLQWNTIKSPPSGGFQTRPPDQPLCIVEIM